MLNEALGQKAMESGGKLRVRSALNPALWLCGIVFTPCLIAATQFENGPPTWLIVLIYIPVALAALGFLFLLIFDRDKLQSEDYQIRKKSLEMIYQKGHSSTAIGSVEAIENPEQYVLENEAGGNPK